MNQIDLLLPFALPPRELTRDLLRDLKMPAFATLLAKSSKLNHQQYDDFSRTLPHEQWLAQSIGLSSADLETSSPPLATTAMRAAGLSVASGFWFVLQPINLHIARDHLVLADPRQLNLSESDSHTLFDIIQPLLEESGHTVLYGDAHTWFMRADDWHALQTSTPDAACGHNIDIWMPKGAHERDWRRIQNEIQMHWHDHRVNEERQMRGLKPVNSVWLWGGAQSETTGDIASDIANNTAAKLVPLPHNFHPAGIVSPTNIKTAASSVVSSANDLFAHSDQHGLLTLDALAEPAMSADWGRWLDQFHVLETDWFAPVLDALKHDQLRQLNMILSHNTALSSFTVSKTSLRKFWVKPSLARLSS